MRTAALGALAGIVVGAGLVVDAVVHGRALISLVVFVPVISGSSGEFLVGVVLLVAGLFVLPLTLWEPSEIGPFLPGDADPAEPSRGSTMEGGGLVLVGPVPIFFGSWRNVSRRTRWVVALVGALVLGLLVLGFVLAWR